METARSVSRAHGDFEIGVGPLAEWKEDVGFCAGTGNVDDQTSKARVGDHSNDLHFRGLRAAHPESAPNGIVARPDAACAAVSDDRHERPACTIVRREGSATKHRHRQRPEVVGRHGMTVVAHESFRIAIRRQRTGARVAGEGQVRTDRDVSDERLSSQCLFDARDECVSLFRRVARSRHRQPGCRHSIRVESNPYVELSLQAPAHQAAGRQQRHGERHFADDEQLLRGGTPEAAETS